MLSLQQVEAKNFEYLFASLPVHERSHVGGLAVAREFLAMVRIEHDDLDAEQSRHRLAKLREINAHQLLRAIRDNFPALLPGERDGVYPLEATFADDDHPRTVEVRGIEGRRELCRVGTGWFVPDGDRLVELGGAVDLNRGLRTEPRKWLYLIVADVEPERTRRAREFQAIRASL